MLDHSKFPIGSKISWIWVLATTCFALLALSVQATETPVPDPESDGQASVRGGTSGTYWVGSGSNCLFDNIQDAINAAGGDREPFTRINIRVAGSNYSQQRLSINLDNFESNDNWHLEELRIIGGYTSCGGALGAGNVRTTLDANALDPNALDPFVRVFSIVYQDDPELERTVALENLIVTGGRVTENEGGFVFHGGGIYALGLPGKLSVQLQNTIVRDNQAVGPSSGGGIYVEASGPEDVADRVNPLPLLWLDDDSAVIANQSEAEGGGIRCVNGFDTDVEVFDTWHVQIGNALIRENSALHGGGFSQQGCRSIVRSGGPYFFNPLLETITYSGGIIDNFAINRGGGIHAIGGGLLQVHGVASPRWGGDPDSAAWIYLNRASRGGGLYAFGGNTRVRLRDVWIENNQASLRSGTAGLGGGIYIGGSAEFLMERWLFSGDVEYTGCSVVRDPLFGFPQRCNGILGNHADGRGGAVFVVNRGSAQIVDSYILNNSSDSDNGAISHASNASNLTGIPYARVSFVNTLIADNSGPNRGIYSGPGGLHDIRYSTIAGNHLESDDSSVIRAFSNDPDRPGLFLILGSIVNDANARSLTSGGDFGAAGVVVCVLANDHIDDLNVEHGTAFFSQVADPEFIDPANGNFRLAQTSPAINYCDDGDSLLVPPVNRDLNLRERDQVFPGEINDPPNPAPGRLYDLGAFVAVEDRLFQDRFQVP